MSAALSFAGTVRFAVRLFRIAVLIAAAWLLNLAARPQPGSSLVPAALLEETHAVFPDAERFQPIEGRHAYCVRDGAGQVLGHLLTTSPDADDLIGYAGPSNVLIVLGADGRVRRVKLLSSGDTQAHVNDVVGSVSFWRRWDGWLPASEPPPRIEAVSGSTLTSLAIAEAIERRLLGKSISLRFPQSVDLKEVRALFPQAAAFYTDEPRPGWQRVVDAHQTTLGFAVRTSPQADNVRGYGGPTEALLAVAADGQSVTAVRLRQSYDTPEYVDRVRQDDDYLSQLAGRSIAQWSELNFSAAGIEGVSGATQTSYAVAEGIRRRLNADCQAQESAPMVFWSMQPRDWGLLTVVLGGMAIAYTPLRSRKWLRIVWQVVLVAGFGLWFGDLLSLALLTGWARHGLPWQTAPVLVLLAALALAAPWGTRRQVYCQHLCPHGVVQEWLGVFPRLHVRIPAGWRWLRPLPWLLLAAAFLLGTASLSFDLAQLEPFDAWVLKSGAIVSAIVAVVGLIASLFVPQAYCRFGCPTGALLKFMRSGGAYDRFHRRDGASVALLALGAMLLLRPAPTSVAMPPEPLQPLVMQGAAFGTTWTIKLRSEVKQPAELQKRISTELDRIENTLSHWRPESVTSQFNASQTTLEMEQPPELVALVAQARELSLATHGAFDITVAPLVRAWGFGPSSVPGATPDDAQVAALLEQVGWQKLHVDTELNTLRKLHPALEIDLGALLQGYAVDRVAALLDSAGIEEYLIEIGGELRAKGAWAVAIEDPANASRPLRVVDLADAALATSGTYRPRSKDGAQGVHHLISPVTGRPVSATIQLATVIAPTCQQADGWATALVVTGLPAAATLADARGLAALFVDRSGQVHTTAKGGALFQPPR